MIFSGFFKIPGGLYAVYLRRDFAARLNLQSRFKFAKLFKFIKLLPAVSLF